MGPVGWGPWGGARVGWSGARGVWCGGARGVGGGGGRGGGACGGGEPDDLKQREEENPETSNTRTSPEGLKT